MEYTEYYDYFWVDALSTSQHFYSHVGTSFWIYFSMS